MNNLQIDYFLTVVNTGSFTAAARALYVSQPAVSKQVSSLENELGIRLLTREKTGASLTDAGKLFYDHFLKAAKGLKQIKHLAQQLVENASMELRFGVVEDWDISGFIPQTLANLKSTFPQLKVHLVSQEIVRILKDLNEGKLDLILYSPMFLDAAQLQGLEEHFLAKARLIVFFSATHPLADKPNLEFKDFAEDTFLLCSRENSAVINHIEALCRQNGFVPRLEVCDSREDVFLKLQTGRGYTLFHEMVRSKSNHAFRYLIPDVPVNSDMRQELCLYHRAGDTNPALQIILQAIHNAMESK